MSSTKDEAPKQKLPYVAPVIVAEELFETLALACGKINPNTTACIQVPSNS